MPLFAVGTSDGLYTLEGFGSYWALSKKSFPNDILTGKPILHRRVDSSHAIVSSVEWLSSDVIAAGLKDSAIFLHDLRSGGSATRLQHPHAVTKMRRVDPYRIVVAGINSVRVIPFPPTHRHIARRGSYLTEISIQTITAPNVRHQIPGQRPPTQSTTQQKTSHVN